MIVLVHNILPPYRVPLFNELSTACHGEFVVLLTRDTYRRDRSWRVPWEGVEFRFDLLRTVGYHVAGHAFDLSFDVGSALEKLNPSAVILAGWHLSASWSALIWAARRNVPVYAWVESARATGSMRGPFSTGIRRLFLRNCRGAIVPGAAAGAFVSELAPDMPWVVAPNAVSMPVCYATKEPRPPWSALFVGELSKRKGFDIVLDAIPDLLTDFDAVTFAGSGPMADRARACARDETRVKYHGFIEGPDLMAAMRRASVVLIPSREDPWPLVAVEALTLGRPVVLGTGVGSAVDLVDLAGAAALRMENADSRSLASAARRARTAVVPLAAREAFQPTEIASRFLSILDGTAASHT